MDELENKRYKEQSTIKNIKLNHNRTLDYTEDGLRIETHVFN
jgi:hypothetical protein